NMNAAAAIPAMMMNLNILGPLLDMSVSVNRVYYREPARSILRPLHEPIPVFLRVHFPDAAVRLG
ncbi:MAG: hypothetical protein WA854_13925, partial [Candidatus Binataceae bacterium]